MTEKFNITKNSINDLITLQRYLSFLIKDIKKYNNIVTQDAKIPRDTVREVFLQHYEDLYYQLEKDNLYDYCFDDFLDLECGLMSVYENEYRCEFA